MTLRLDVWPVRALQATLHLSGSPQFSGELPPLWHWLYFLHTERRSVLGADGHPAPADQDPSRPGRRLFAAARIEFERPLRLGESARLTESVIASRETQGTSGPLRIVTHEYRYFQQHVCCIREQRDIIYLGPHGPHAQDGSGPRAGAAAAYAEVVPPGPPGWMDAVTPDPVLLFRFSALTFNAHRIHYDRQYAASEGHRERVVHGPLTAILLAETLRARRSGRLRRFEFRARRPLFVNEPIRLIGNPSADRITLQALEPAGAVAMEALASG